MPEILLVEDEPTVRAALIRTLRDNGMQVLPVGTALDALRAITIGGPDLVILDLGLPDLDGTSVLRMLRGISDVPVIIATARGDEHSIVELLDAGADDYVVKPFAGKQLVARINALLRRVKAAVPQDGMLEVGGLHIDTWQRMVKLDGRAVDLHRLEFEVLSYLAARRDTVVTRQELSREVWRQRHLNDSQTIDVHISWLRRKLGETAANPRYLHTIRGVGFKLTAPRP
ncbi:MAG TPA: response regulator transcription factor [Pseudonocardiaceae bacterium]|jgi:DNA-binding response OmpR family regulator|nr:response regulator transcription factor [Pseudonocardiaceae bacterium]